MQLHSFKKEHKIYSLSPDRRFLVHKHHSFLAWTLGLLLFFSASIWAGSAVPRPKDFFGHAIGEDYFLATYAQLEAYWKTLAAQSDKITLEEIGKTAEGRTMLMAVITSPENQKNLAQYKSTARRLALAKDLSAKEAKRLASEGKAVVWIDGGLHASEVLGAQQLIELVYQMVAGQDAETQRILDQVVLLAVLSNPDGMDFVSNWYMRNPDPQKRSTRGLPHLYHKYIGHDNNRDFYMSTQPETEAINRVLYREWFPQIVYNHHQTGPSGTVLFAPPFRDPFNYCFDPLVPLGIELVGTAMHDRFAREGKPGATMRSGAPYSTWWNGGLRTTVYFHNMIGILTETIGNPTPMEIPFIPQKQLPKNDYPYPISPQKWHFRQSIDYSITADKAILDLSSKLRENFLFNIYRMGKNSIERGSRDWWTMSPKRIAAVEAAIKKDKARMAGSGRSRGYPKKYYDSMFTPESRDPRGYVIPADQVDFLTAIKFINTLIKNGITVLRASQDFTIEGKTYPRGSYVIKSAQAFRPHLLTMFEPQNYPDDIPYPGAPPRPTYDNAGWTLAYQMGIRFDRILEGFDGPFEEIPDLVPTPAGKVVAQGKTAGFLLDHRVNDAFIAVNRLLARNQKIFWMKNGVETETQRYPEGVFFIPAKRSTQSLLEAIAKDTGLVFQGIKSWPKGDAFALKPTRVGIWDRYGGSIASGWLRWLLEQYEFPFKVVYPPELDAGGLNKKYDVLIFASGAIPAYRGMQRGIRRSTPSPRPDIPAEYQNRIGRVTAVKTIPQLLDFVKKGGAVLAIGSSTQLGYHAGLPIQNALAEFLPDGTEKPLPRTKFFIPGSILKAKVNNSNPLAHGMQGHVDVTFNFSPAFRLKPEAAFQSINPVAWYDSKTPLCSGWGWGQGYLKGGIAVIDASIGRGKLFLFGPEIIFRGQPHGTFKLLFNGIFYGTASPATRK